jgi:signal transduction histidine kinase
MDVTLELSPSVDAPQTLQLAAYRVVQEALTNAGRHAPGSVVRVRVDADPAALCVDVISTGGRAGHTPRGGHGLVGMRERVRMLGGKFSAGRTDAGFVVAARLPLALTALR